MTVSTASAEWDRKIFHVFLILERHPVVFQVESNRGTPGCGTVTGDAVCGTGCKVVDSTCRCGPFLISERYFTECSSITDLPNRGDFRCWFNQIVELFRQLLSIFRLGALLTEHWLRAQMRLSLCDQVRAIVYRQRGRSGDSFLKVDIELKL